MLNTQKQTQKLLPSEKKMLKEAMSRLSTMMLLSKNENDIETLLDAMENLHQLYCDEFEVH